MSNNDIQYEKLENGISVYRFTDAYGHGCSIEESLIKDNPKVWLGVDNKVSQNSITMTDRMYITQEQMIKLLPLLQHFAEYGELPSEE